MLPFSTVSGTIAMEDAFFTAASAVTVTGLIVVDTATYPVLVLGGAALATSIMADLLQH